MFHGDVLSRTYSNYNSYIKYKNRYLELRHFLANQKGGADNDLEKADSLVGKKKQIAEMKWFVGYSLLTEIDFTHPSKIKSGVLKKITKAFARAKKAIQYIFQHEDDVKNPNFHLILGKIQYLQGDLEEAEKTFQFVLSLDDDLPDYEACFYLALVYIRQNKFTEARDFFEKVKNTNEYVEHYLDEVEEDDKPNVVQQYILILEDTGKTDTLRKTIQEQNRLAQPLSSKQSSKNTGHYVYFPLILPGLPISTKTQAEMEASKKNRKQRKKLIKNGIATFKQAEKKTEISEQYKLYHKSRDYFRRAQHLIDTSDIEALIYPKNYSIERNVNVLYYLGRISEAYKQHIHKHAAFGWSNTRLKRAEFFLLRAIALKPNHVGANLYLGMVYLEQERLMESKKQLQKTLKLKGITPSEKTLVEKSIFLIEQKESQQEDE